MISWKKQLAQQMKANLDEWTKSVGAATQLFERLVAKELAQFHLGQIHQIYLSTILMG